MSPRQSEVEIVTAFRFGNRMKIHRADENLFKMVDAMDTHQLSRTLYSDVYVKSVERKISRKVNTRAAARAAARRAKQAKHVSSIHGLQQRRLCRRRFLCLYKRIRNDRADICSFMVDRLLKIHTGSD